MHGSTHTLAHRAHSRQRRHTCRSRHERPSSDCEHACTTCVAQRGATRTARRRPYKSDFLHDLYRQKLVKDTSQTTHSHTQYHPGFRAVDTLPVLCKAWGWGTQKDPPCDEWDHPDCASVVRKWYGGAPPLNVQCTGRYVRHSGSTSGCACVREVACGPGMAISFLKHVSMQGSRTVHFATKLCHHYGAGSAVYGVLSVHLQP